MQRHLSTTPPDMDLQQLRAFLAVAERGSFSAAAGHLGLTQPAVSKRVAALEALLGRRLFDRIGRHVQLTEAGHTLRGEATDILRQVMDLQRTLSGEPDRVGGTLRMATSHHIGLHRLAPALRAFRRRYPDVLLDLRFEDSEVAHELVRSGNCELAVVTLDPAGQLDLTSRLLWDDPLRFIVAPEHDLASGRHRLVDLADHPAIVPGVGTYTGKLITELFARAGVRLSASMQTNYLETIRMLVAAGYGWSALPATMIESDLATITLRGAEPPARQLGTVTHPQRTLSAAAAAFADVLEAYSDAREG